MKFELNEKEEKSAEEFRKEHDPVCPNSPGVSALYLGEYGSYVANNHGTYQYVFDNNTGIGQGCTIQCSCGANCDITDYSAW